MHSQDPVTKEEWYNAQKFQSETIKTVENHLSELKGDIKEQLNRIETQTTQTNGSVKTLQIWKAGMKGWMNGFGLADESLPTEDRMALSVDIRVMIWFRRHLEAKPSADAL